LELEDQQIQERQELTEAHQAFLVLDLLQLNRLEEGKERALTVQQHQLAVLEAVGLLTEMRQAQPEIHLQHPQAKVIQAVHQEAEAVQVEAAAVLVGRVVHQLVMFQEMEALEGPELLRQFQDLQ
tara:strand:+ start:1224 stop:1598 length:375 start_codon:yes stop_codon:yes gene_type:complete